MFYSCTFFLLLLLFLRLFQRDWHVLTTWMTTDMSELLVSVASIFNIGFPLSVLVALQNLSLLGFEGHGIFAFIPSHSCFVRPLSPNFAPPSPLHQCCPVVSDEWHVSAVFLYLLVESKQIPDNTNCEDCCLSKCTAVCCHAEAG